MKNMNLRDLLIQKIQALYDIEHVLVRALPKMAKAATMSELKMGFTEHLAETKKHIERLEKVFTSLRISPKKLKSAGIRGIVEDGEWVIKNVKPVEALDANLARAAQYAEHYEMAGYLAAIDWATALGEPKVVELLSQNLGEEELADAKLRKVGKILDEQIA